MVSRFAGVSLGLIAFAVTAVAGLVTRNPVESTLSRCLFALFLFYILGLILGGVADRVIAEHAMERRAQIQERFRANLDHAEGDPPPEDLSIPPTKGSGQIA